MDLKVFAKINLCLKIVGVEPSGFHKLDMILTSVDIADVVSFEACGGVEVYMDGKLSGADNSAARALNALIAAGLAEGGRVDIKKGIPFEAGLGGSSADAAAVIAAAQRVYGFGDGEAFEIAERVGSDVPFMLKGGAARARGRGEKLDFFKLDKKYALIAKPEKGVSTPQAYKTYDQIGSGKICQTEKLFKRLGNGEDFGGLLINELYDAARLLNPSVGSLAESLSRYSDDVVMSGSGSAVAAFFKDGESARKAAEKTDAAYKKIVETAPFGIEFLS